MIMFVKFIRVRGKVNGKPGYTKDLLERACSIDHDRFGNARGDARILEYVEGGDNEFAANIAVESHDFARSSSQADYYRDKLLSHGMGAKVYNTPEEIAEEYGSFRLIA